MTSVTMQKHAEKIILLMYRKCMNRVFQVFYVVSCVFKNY